MNKLNEKVAVITGGASGIGKSTAKLFLEEGAKVLISDINTENLKLVKEEFSEYTNELIIYKADVAIKNEVEKMFDYAVSIFGKVDILVNNAGIMDNLTPIADMNDELWDKIHNTNLNSVMFGTRYAVQYFLKENIKGNIINNSSLSGVCGGRGGLAYTVSKYGVIGLTKNVAFMYANKGIRCNAICPSNTATNILSTMVPNELGLERAKTGYSGSTGIATTDQIASTALFLASEDSSFVNGVSLVVDGGWSSY